MGGTKAIDLLQYEGLLMSSVYCCNILDDTCAQDAQDKNYTTAYGYAKVACQSFANGLKEAAGVELCPGVETPPPCYVCGDETKKVGKPDANVPTTEFTCGEAEQAGLNGLIAESDCALIEGAFSFISGICGCEPKDGGAGPESSPTASPTKPESSASPTNFLANSISVAAVTGLVAAASLWM